MTAFPLARSVRPVEGGAGGRTAQPLVETSAQSWAETDLKSLASGKVEFNGDQGDRQGPIALGAAVSAPATEPPTPAGGNATPDAPKPESRIVTTGDSDFVANNAIGIQGNQDFFLNSVNWLAQQENLIAIRPRDAQDRRITLTADQQQRIMLLSLLVIPGLVFAAGGVHLVAEALTHGQADLHDRAGPRPGRAGAYIYFVDSKRPDGGRRGEGRRSSRSRRTRSRRSRSPRTARPAPFGRWTARGG